MKEIKAYQTEDGRIFAKEIEAKIHEEYKKLLQEEDIRVNIYYSGCLRDWTITARKTDSDISEAVERELLATLTNEDIRNYYDLFITELGATLETKIIEEEE